MHPFFRILPVLAAFCLAPLVQAVDIQRWTTPEGTKILLVERHENPIVDMRISFKGAGSAFNPPGKGEVSEFTAALLTDGTAKLDEEAFNARANDIAANIGSSSGDESASIGLRSLSKPANLNAAVDLVNQSLTRPRFDAAVFARRQKQSITALQQSETDPGFIAERALTRLNYPDHPYGSEAKTSAASIGAVTLDDIRAFHRNHYAKNNAVVSVVGDLTRRQTEALVQKALAGLPATSGESGNIPAVPAHPGQRQNIPFAGEQAQVVLGMPLISRNDPDCYALVAGNYILGGGGFDSRLMKTLRDEHGYTYGASSSLAPLTEAGPFTLGFSTKKASAAEALAAAQNVLAGFIAEGPTEAELQQAKDNIIGAFPLRFDSNAKLLPYLNLIGVYSLPDDYLEAYPKAIAGLTTEQVKSAWQRRVKPQDMNIVVVGAESGHQ
ncbi:MAG: pitrilysin family protein [Neisseria sp.]|nr:pitrilysin family protein [Neisseria sp.]